MSKWNCYVDALCLQSEDDFTYDNNQLPLNYINGQRMERLVCELEKTENPEPGDLIVYRAKGQSSKFDPIVHAAMYVSPGINRSKWQLDPHGIERPIADDERQYNVIETSHYKQRSLDFYKNFFRN